MELTRYGVSCVVLPGTGLFPGMGHLHAMHWSSVTLSAVLGKVVSRSLPLTRACPVAALLGYLAIRAKRSGPVFIFQDGSTLSQKRLVSSLHQILSDVGVSTAQYNGNSFRICAAIMAAKLGVPDSLVKKMGIVRV